MRSLFLKIFAIFWLAQSLIFIISTGLLIRQHFPREGAAFEALDAHLKRDALEAATDFGLAGCDAFAGHAQPAGALLFDATGAQRCRTSNAPNVGDLHAPLPNRIEVEGIKGRYMWLVPVQSPGGRFIYAWLQPPFQHQPPPAWDRLLHFANPQVPVAIAIGGLTTFVLTLLFTRPLVRLRAAARALAEGNLQMRVEEPARSRAGKPVDDFQGLVHDFNHMAGQLESLVSAQKLLLRDVSHELRSPLARLSVALELVRDNAGSGLDEHFGRIEREAAKLNTLIGQLLTLSSLETRGLAANVEAGSLNNLCQAIVPDAMFEAQQRPCAIELIEEDDQCTVRGDSDLLYRAIENVIRNAIRYTRPSTLVTVRLSRLRRDQHHFAVIQVDDAGPGIPEQELANVFQPFYRVDRARTSSTGGFGVGLAIVERAVRLHAGVVRAINRDWGGTSIRIELPIAAPPT